MLDRLANTVKIYTADHPPPGGSIPNESIPKKKPYIILNFLVTPDNTSLLALFKEDINALISLGFWIKQPCQINNSNCYITITGNRKVIKALTLCTTKLGLFIDEPTLTCAKQYIKKCEAYIPQKPPSKSKHINNFAIQQYSLPKSFNDTYLMLHKNKKYIYKKNKNGRSISELELFNIMCYRLLLNKRHPKGIGIHGTEGERQGIAVEKIPKLKTIWEYYCEINACNLYILPVLDKTKLAEYKDCYILVANELYYINPYGTEKKVPIKNFKKFQKNLNGINKNKPTIIPLSFQQQYTLITKNGGHVKERKKISKEKIIQSEMVYVWLAAYFEQEVDLHISNYGLDKDGIGIKFDGDRSTWLPLTEKYFSSCYPKDTNIFKVTKKDFINFPHLIDSTPFHWVNKINPCNSDEHFDLDSISTDDQFIKDKYYLSLKRILIPKEAYQEIGKASIRSDKKRNQLTEHKHNKTNEIRNTVLYIADFRKYILDNPKIIDRILDDFEDYNLDFTKEKDCLLRVDLNIIKNNFNDLTCQIKIINQLSFLKATFKDHGITIDKETKEKIITSQFLKEQCDNIKDFDRMHRALLHHAVMTDDIQFFKKLTLPLQYLHKDIVNSAIQYNNPMLVKFIMEHTIKLDLLNYANTHTHATRKFLFWDIKSINKEKGDTARIILSMFDDKTIKLNDKSKAHIFDGNLSNIITKKTYQKYLPPTIQKAINENIKKINTEFFRTRR